MSHSTGLAAAVLALVWVAAPADTRAATDEEVKPAERKARVFGFHRGGGHLGVSLADIGPEDAKRLGLAEERGALVKSVADDSPAARAGVKADDVIVAYEGETVRSAAHLARLVRETPAGRKVALTVSRGGARQDLAATLDEPRHVMRIPDVRIEGLEGLEDLEIPAPPVPPLPPLADGEIGNAMREALRLRPRLGISYHDLSDQLARHFKVEGGLLVSSVSEGSAAEKAGLRAGDIIVKVDGQAVRSGRDLVRRVSRLEAEQQLTLSVQRDGRLMDLRIQPEPRERRRPAGPTT